MTKPFIFNKIETPEEGVPSVPSVLPKKRKKERKTHVIPGVRLEYFFSEKGGNTGNTSLSPLFSML